MRRRVKRQPEPRRRGIFAVGTAWLTMACSAAPPPAARVEPVSEPLIEPSEGVEETTELLGAGDDEAERCFRRAATIDEDSTEKCRESVIEACADVAADLVTPAPVCAAKIRELACAAEHARSCADLAMQLHKQPNRQPTRVRKLLDRACTGGIGTACAQLARMERKRLGATDPGVTRWFDKGCELGDGASCFEAAESTRLGAAKRAELFQRGCDLGFDRACLTVGLMLLVGAHPFPRDEARGKQILMTLCNGTGGEAKDACFSAGEHEKACNKGHFNSCMAILDGHHRAGRIDETIALATKLVKEQPNNWLLRWVRGSNLFNSGKHKASIPDLEALIPLRPDWPLVEIWLYAAQERSGGQGKARLEAAFAKMDSSSWPAPVFKFMLGRLSMGQLLRAAKDKDVTKQKQQECEAFYYVGQQLMIRGQTKRAKAMFQKSVDTAVTNYIEYRGAKAELVLLAP